MRKLLMTDYEGKSQQLFFFVHDTVAMIFAKSQDPLITIKVCSGNKCYFKQPSKYIGNCRNVRGLGKSMVVSRLFAKLGHSNERSSKFESLYQE